MQTIELETRIAAPQERCFLLSLSIDLHTKSAASTSESAIGGVTHGIIGPGERVLWRGRHFGLWLRHESIISCYERPFYFQDSMMHGIFRHFEHDHFFNPEGNNTLMRDVLRFAAPFGPVGRLAETLVLRRHLERFLRQRNDVIRTVAESDRDWQRFSEPNQ